MEMTLHECIQRSAAIAENGNGTRANGDQLQRKYEEQLSEPPQNLSESDQISQESETPISSYIDKHHGVKQDLGYNRDHSMDHGLKLVLAMDHGVKQDLGYNRDHSMDHGTQRYCYSSLSRQQIDSDPFVQRARRWGLHSNVMRAFAYELGLERLSGLIKEVDEDPEVLSKGRVLYYRLNQIAPKKRRTRA